MVAFYLEGQREESSLERENSRVFLLKRSTKKYRCVHFVLSLCLLYCTLGLDIEFSLLLYLKKKRPVGTTGEKQCEVSQSVNLKLK